jgi:hypothetical protein
VSVFQALDFLLKNNNSKKFKTKRKIRFYLFLILKLVEDVARCFVDVDSFE